eukprot:4552224-Pleurochrysis_carterae.AAC.2
MHEANNRDRHVRMRDRSHSVRLPKEGRTRVCVPRAPARVLASLARAAATDDDAHARSLTHTPPLTRSRPPALACTVAMLRLPSAFGTDGYCSSPSRSRWLSKSDSRVCHDLKRGSTAEPGQKPRG